MDGRREHRSVWILGAAALAVIILLVVLFFRTQKDQADHDTAIALPEPVQPAVVQTEPAEAVPSQLEVTRDNVQSVIASLSRPEAYHQTMTVTTTAGEKSFVKNVELWISGGLMRAEVQDDNDRKSLLTDGETLYLWYEDDSEAAELPLHEGVSGDDLTGIPTYEMLLDVPKEQIKEASFVTLDDAEESRCIFVSLEQDTVIQYFWISTDTGLLYKHTMLEDGEMVYAAEQQSLSLLADTDASLDDVFTLPNGSRPFPS